MDKSTNVTGTGVAVALAVIVIVALVFFGSKIYKIINNSPIGVVANSTQSGQNQTAQTAANTQNPMNQTNESPETAAILAGIPANVTQLMSKDEVVGTGAEAQTGDTVTVNYVGMLTNGTVFDASANHGTTGFSFPLGAGQVIKGWDEGVVGMKVGGKRILVIPASLGYGAQSVGPIPANSTLVFEVELLNVTPPASK